MRFRDVCACALVVVWMTLSASSAAAQSTRTEVGIKGGINFASLTNFSDAVGDVGLDTGMRTGLVFGGYVSRLLSDTLAIQPEVLFVQKGIKITGGAAGIPADSAVKLSYLEIPVLLQYRFGTGGVKPYAFAGPAISFNTGAHVSSAVVGLTGNQDVDIGDQVRNVDGSIIVGGGVMGPRWLAELRFARGLSAANESSAADLTQNVHNSGVTVAFGVRF